MDPVPADLLLTAIGGVNGAVGCQAWHWLRDLVLFRYVPLAEQDPPSGVDEVVMLQQAPASLEAATRLAAVLQARAEADAEFREALQRWLGAVTRLAGVLQARAKTDAEWRAAQQRWLSEMPDAAPGSDKDIIVIFPDEHQRAGTPYDGSSRAAAVRNEVSGGHSGNVVQVGNNYGGVRIGNAVQDDPSDIRDPLVITVEVRYGSVALDLVVDADPPRAMAPSGTLYVVTVQARTTRAVILHRVRPVVLSRRQPRRACSIGHITGKLEPRTFTADFDADPPRFEAEGTDFPFTVSATDPEQFWFTPAVSVQETAWRLELDWSCLDHSGTAVIDDGGLPFEMYPHTLLRNKGGGFTALHLDCDELGMGHLPDCPARRLNGSRRNVFGPVRPR